MNKKGRVIDVKHFLSFALLITISLLIFSFFINSQLKERCEVLCDLGNEAGTSLNMCVELVNDLADADISSNFTRLNCKEICR